ncbi:MAG: F0F1 ATP synthase subunit A [Elusimicrobia bacterium]|nr:F0F1 ATP synthase subunit A [Elusimicrobiota bacterium]
MDFLHLLEHHLLDHPLASGITVFGVALPITKHVVMMWISAAVLAITMPLLARRWPLVPSGGRGLLESFVVFLRDDVILPNTGEEGRPYLPYFITLFFFILVTSLLGQIPGASTATGNISVTAALSLCTLVLINVAGIREHGFVHHFQNFIPHGLPGWLVPLMFPLEIMGLFTRCFALTIRLFANMIAGHIVILSFLALIFLLGSVFVAVPSVLLSVGLGLLEIFVCFLQAYIFTMLSAIFVGASLHPH